MKRISITLPVILFIMLVSQRASAQDYRLAAGVRLANTSPTLSSGISVKYFATDKTALEALVSWGNRFGFGGLLEVHNKFHTRFKLVYWWWRFCRFSGWRYLPGPYRHCRTGLQIHQCTGKSLPGLETRTRHSSWYQLCSGCVCAYDTVYFKMIRRLMVKTCLLPTADLTIIYL